VIVRLADPLPRSIDIFCFDLQGLDTGSIDTREVLDRGVALRYVRRRGWIPEAGAKPAEIIILSRKVRVWERMLEEIP
jgi:hypothetical protein